MNQIDEHVGVSPFSSTGLATIALTGRPPITVVTQAVETATDLLGGYLRPGRGETGDGAPIRTPGATSDGNDPSTGGILERSVGSRPGRLLVISGDYGTGKTHLANYLLRQAHRQRGWAAQQPQPQIVAHCGYVMATSGGFERLYRDLLASFHRDELAQTVDDSYADIVADALDSLDSTKDIAIALRSGQVGAAEVVEDLDLIDSLLARQLRTELGKIAKRAGLGQAARSDEFGDALALLLLQREQLGDAVWDWLGGGAPSPTLTSRGIVHPIQGEEMALQALGVFAYLFGRSRHRLVLAIDELDRILMAPDRPQTPVAERFRRLLETFDAAGAFLIVAALPDLFEKLGGSAGRRPGQWVDLEPFTQGEIGNLITQVHSDGRLEPFTDDAPELIRAITGGTPRSVIRLCFRAWQLKIDRKLAIISPDVIVAAARAQADFPTLTVVRNDIRSILQKLRLSFRRQYWHPGVFKLIDFWVTRESSGASCAIVIRNSVVTESDVKALIDLAEDLHLAPGEGSGRHLGASVSTLLVITGHLRVGFRERVIGAFESEPIQYGMYDFSGELGGAITRALAGTGGQHPEDALLQLQAGIGRLAVQQAHSQDYLDRLALRLDELNGTISQIPAALRESAPARASRLPSGQQTLSPPVQRLFDQVRRSLDRLLNTTSVFRAEFDPTIPLADLLSRRERLWPWLEAPRFYQTVGALTTVRDLVVAFETAVTGFFAHHHTAASGSAGADDVAGLRRICESYDMVLDHMRLFDLADHPVTLDAEPDSTDLAIRDWLDRWQSARDQLQDLGAAVIQTALPLSSVDDGQG
ncbi:MAG: ATP-binding protein [Micromonosporaceae bacterium]|nr:ATP-binding protein [Micromonosporaceae bacterium]